jgi:hypothetical protein
MAICLEASKRYSKYIHIKASRGILDVGAGLPFPWFPVRESTPSNNADHERQYK